MIGSPLIQEHGLHRRAPSIRRIRLLNGGAGRGARLLIPTIRAFNERSERYRIEPLYVDPGPMKAAILAREAIEAGIQAQAIEARIEDVLPALPAAELGGVVGLNIDRPQAIAAALRAAAVRDQAVLGFLFIATPAHELYGLRLAMQADEREVKETGARFFESLAPVTARSGGAWVIGERGRPEHRAAEPMYRDWFARDLESNFPKLVAGIEPESNPIELTRDGRTTLPAVLADSSTAWRSPQSLASEIIANPPMPLLRGEDFTILESGPDGIRIHHVRLRTTDGQMAIFGTAAVDPAAVSEAQQRERTRLAEEAIQRRAERSTLTRIWSAFTTD